MDGGYYVTHLPLRVMDNDILVLNIGHIINPKFASLCGKIEENPLKIVKLWGRQILINLLVTILDFVMIIKIEMGFGWLHLCCPS